MFDPHKVVEKPWGKEIWLSLDDKYCFKRIEINAGHKTSLQYHNEKCETNYLLEGEAILTLGKETHHLKAGDVVYLPVGTIHRFEAITNIVLMEASTPQVEDVIRLEDSYGRKDKS